MKTTLQSEVALFAEAQNHYTETKLKLQNMSASEVIMEKSLPEKEKSKAIILMNSLGEPPSQI